MIGDRSLASLLAACALAGIALMAAMAPQQPAADPFVGTWTLNMVKSKYTPGPAPKSATIVITMQGKTVTTTVDSIDAAGAASHWMYSAAADGKDYPASGNPSVDTVALQQIDPRTVEVIQKKAGKPMLSVRRTVSTDGKTMTITSSGKNAAGVAVTNVAVYDRKS